MSFADLVTSRLTFGARFNDPSPATAANLAAWFQSQLKAPVADDSAVTSRLAKVTLPLTLTDSAGVSTTTNPPLQNLNLTPTQLWAIQALDTSSNRGLTRRPAEEVIAASWIRGAFSPWQIQEVMTDFWHNHFSVDAFQNGTISVMWPAYDYVLRSNALGNFRAMLAGVAKSASMMYYLNQAQSVAAQPNENFAREIMELHTLGIGCYLGETAAPGTESTGYSDTDVIAAARILTGWTIGDGHRVAADGSKSATGEFIFSPPIHDYNSKVIFGQTWPATTKGDAVAGQAEGERLLTYLAGHPGTARFICTKLYVHFVQDVPPANDPLIAAMAQTFQAHVNASNQIPLVLAVLFNSSEFAASAGQKVKTPFQFLISLLRATGAEINPQSNLSYGLNSLGAPLFHWPTPNGMPDLASAWTGSNDMIRRWALASYIPWEGSKILADSPTTLFAQIAIGLNSTNSVVDLLTPLMLGGTVSSATKAALYQYAATNEILGAKGALNDQARLLNGVRALVGAMAATPEFQTR